MHALTVDQVARRSLRWVIFQGRNLVRPRAALPTATAQNNAIDETLRCGLQHLPTYLDALLRSPPRYSA
jgi:hypothetical protein